MTATVASAAKRITRKLLLASSIALVAWSGCTPYISTSSVEFKSLSEEIRQRVQRLEYPESVAQDFADMTLAWKDTRGRPLVVVCKRRLDEATQHHQQGRISKGNLAQVQQAIARDLSHKIRAELRSGEGVFDLADVVKRRECNCVGRMQTLYILGTTVGLSLQPMDVYRCRERFRVRKTGHVACLLSLADGRSTIVDPSLWFVSRPFALGKAYAKAGSVWELRGPANPSDLYWAFRVVDSDRLAGSVHNSRGCRYVESGQDTMAMNEYTKAISLDPRNASVYYNRAKVYRRCGNVAMAISDYTQAIRLNPHYGEDYYCDRASAYCDLGEHDKAVADYVRAIKLNPLYGEAHLGRGTAYAKLGQNTKAVADLTRAIELNPRDAIAYYNRGGAHAKLGQDTKAVADYSKAIELDPEDPDGYYARGRAYARLREYANAVADYTKAIELNPKHALAYHRRGVAYAHLGQHTKAIADYTKAIELSRKDAIAYYNRGLAYASLSEHAKAVSDYTKAIELNPRYALAYYNRGMAYASLGQADSARKDLLRAVELQPSLKEHVRKAADRFKLHLEVNHLPAGDGQEGTNGARTRLRHGPLAAVQLMFDWFDRNVPVGSRRPVPRARKVCTST